MGTIIVCDGGCGAQSPNPTTGLHTANSASATLWEENERALAARQAAAEADLQARVAADGADARRSYRAQAIRDVVAVATGAGVWLAVGMMAAHWPGLWTWRNSRPFRCE